MSIAPIDLRKEKECPGPRGRIVYEVPTRRFVMYADRRLQKPEIIDALKTAFGLNEAKLIVRSDLHYR